MIQIARIKKDLDYINSINSSKGRGYTRFSYSEEDERVRKYICQELESLGVEVKVDPIGNLRGLYNPLNSKLGSVMIGSHIDTVPNGGQFDGLLGSVTALEIIRTMAENKVEVKRPVEFIVFAEEEGSNFSTTMLGSKAMAGKVDLAYLKTITTDSGQSAYDFLKDKGYEVDRVGECQITKDEISYMIEFHVEQGAVLDSEGLSIGIVENIAGMDTLKVSFKGVSNHAGSTPMGLRKDPMLGAAELILFVNDLASNKSNDTSVATVGKISVSPNGSNVIAENVDIFIDIRDINQEEIDRLNLEIRNEAERLGKKYGLKVSTDLVGKSKPAVLSQEVRHAIENSVKSLGYEYKKMNSGAVHDSVMLVDYGKVGMIFVPSIGGLSHTPEEATNFEDIEKGARVYYKAVLDLAMRED